VILGDAELEAGQVELKDLGARTQEKVARADIVRILAERTKATP
jgi:histidyl-tRNA synthetase